MDAATVAPLGGLRKKVLWLTDVESTPEVASEIDAVTVVVIGISAPVG